MLEFPLSTTCFQYIRSVDVFPYNSFAKAVKTASCTANSFPPCCKNSNRFIFQCIRIHLFKQIGQKPSRNHSETERSICSLLQPPFYGTSPRCSCVQNQSQPRNRFPFFKQSAIVVNRQINSFSLLCESRIKREALALFSILRMKAF